MSDILETIENVRKNKSSLLNLSGKGLEKIPLEVFELDFVTNLNLRNNNISEIPEDFSKLKNLKVAYFDSNKISFISDKFYTLNQLTVLNLNYNELTELPNGIGHLVNLKKLLVSNNNLNSIAQSIGELSELEIFDLSSNAISDLPKEIGELNNLTRLYLSKNKLSNFEIDCRKLRKLEWLMLKSNQLSDVSQTIGNLKNLIRLDLADNKLSKTPSNLNKLDKLTELNLSENSISYLELDVRKMKNLNELKVYLNSNMEIKDKLVSSLLKRKSWSESQFKLIIDNNQAQELSKFKDNFKSGGIGVIDFENKMIPLGHYKQIGPDIVEKYELKDPMRERLRDEYEKNNWAQQRV